MKTFLALTVGTGTAGRQSNLEQGLVHTLQLIQPDAYWLVPSADEYSQLIAEEMRSKYPANFQSWSDDVPFFSVADPDDLSVCVTTMRTVLDKVRTIAGESDRIMVNPTSGTKQMSAGATLAALNADVDLLTFTVGERADGVVITGTERLQEFPTLNMLYQRDLITARALFTRGSYAGAATVLRRYRRLPDAARAMAMAECMDVWHRHDYAGAAAKAATFDQSLATQLNAMAKEKGWSERILADLVRGADHLFAWGVFDEALTRYYRAVEYAARLRLAAHVKHSDPFRYDELMTIANAQSRSRLRENRDGSCMVGLTQIVYLLAGVDDKFAGLMGQERIQNLMDARNQSVHNIRSVSRDDAESAKVHVRRLLDAVFPRLDELIKQLRDQEPTI